MVAMKRLDHLVLTVADVARTITFYEAIGMEAFTFDGRWALRFGQSKINLHQRGHELEPHAGSVTPGSSDMCFVVAGPMDDVVADLRRAGLTIELGPLQRTGALGPMESVYLRDPDGNLVELAVYPDTVA